MKNRIIALIMSLVLTVSALAGCGPQKLDTVIKEPVKKQDPKPQVAITMNPILAYESGENAIAFNDIKNAMSNDRKAATLTSLYNDTGWVWAYKQGEEWKKRGIYGIDKWRNGGNISTDKISA